MHSTAGRRISLKYLRSRCSVLNHLGRARRSHPPPPLPPSTTNPNPPSPFPLPSFPTPSFPPLLLPPIPPLLLSPFLTSLSFCFLVLAIAIIPAQLKRLLSFAEKKSLSFSSSKGTPFLLPSPPPLPGPSTTAPSLPRLNAPIPVEVSYYQVRFRLDLTGISLSGKPYYRRVRFHERLPAARAVGGASGPPGCDRGCTHSGASGCSPYFFEEKRICAIFGAEMQPRRSQESVPGITLSLSRTARAARESLFYVIYSW